MKRICCVLISLILFFSLTACQRQEDMLYDQLMQQVRENPIPEKLREDLIPEATAAPPTLPSLAPVLSPEPGDDLQGELTVKQYIWLGDQSNLRWLAEEFMQLHPGVTIRFDYELDARENNNLTVEERKLRRESFYAGLRMELASGESDYILFDVPEEINLPQLARNGLLTDLRPYWEGDPDIQRADYFENVVDAFTVDGKMPLLPLSFQFEVVFLSRPVLEEIDAVPASLFAVDSDRLLDWYEQARETQPDMNLLYTSPGKDVLYSTERYRYLEPETKTALFDSPEFVSFLERTVRVLNDDPELDPAGELGRGYGALADEAIRFQATGEVPESVLLYGSADNFWANMVTKSRPFFACVNSVQVFSLLNTQQPLENIAGPYPLTSTDGKLGLSSNEVFAVPSGCQNPDLAWEFIKYCLREREQLTFSYLGPNVPGVSYTNKIPVNKNTFEKMVEEYAAGKDVGVIGYSRFDGIDTEAVLNTLDRILSLRLVNAAEYGIDVQDYLDEYYLQELTTPGQCAAKIQGRAKIWLNE